MSAYSFYPGKPSFLAMKYLRTYTPNTQLEPGERYRLRRDMEYQVAQRGELLPEMVTRLRCLKSEENWMVPGYSEISRDLRCVSEEIEYARFKSPDRDLPPPSWLRNSVVGYTTDRCSGNQYRTTHYPTNTRFSRATTPMLTSCNGMNKVYRYYGTHCY